MKKLILFGGTFDPVHNGHITVAKAAAEYKSASKVILIPARRSPHKHQKPFAEDDDRVAMLKSAVIAEKMFEICPVELNRAEPSYTIDTIRYFRERFGKDCQLNWLIGADMLTDLPRWHKAEELLNECNICTMYRGGFKEPDFDCLHGKFATELIDKLRKNTLQTPKIDISSTQIRRMLLNGQDINSLVNPEVYSYIKKHKLYTLDHQLSRNEDI